MEGAQKMFVEWVNEGLEVDKIAHWWPWWMLEEGGQKAREEEILEETKNVQEAEGKSVKSNPQEQRQRQQRDSECSGGQQGHMLLSGQNWSGTLRVKRVLW